MAQNAYRPARDGQSTGLQRTGEQPTPATFPTTPLTATASDATLSDDWIQTADVVVAPTSPTPLAVFTRDDGTGGGTVTEALVIQAPTTEGGPTTLVHLQIDPASDSGWKTVPVQGGSGASEVVAGVHSDGDVHAFFTAGSRLNHATYDGKAWRVVGAFDNCVSPRTMVAPATGRLSAYGVTPKGDLMLVQPSGAQWQAATVAFSGALAGTSPMLCPGFQQNWVAAAVVDGRLQMWSGEGAQVLEGPQTVPTPTPVTEVIAAYGHERSAMFMSVDGEGNLYANVGFTDVVAQVPNADVRAGQGLVGADGWLHVYGVSARGVLSVSHQIDWGDSGPVFAEAIPLDTGISHVATDRSPQAAAALFAVGTDRSLRYHAQDQGNQTWWSSRAQRSAAVNYQVPRYRAQVDVLDANLSRVPGVQLKVTAQSATAVWIGGKTYQIDAATPATCTTDAMGRVTIAAIAGGLHTPELTISGADLVAPISVAPACNVQDYLAGKGTLNELQPFGAATLVAAKTPAGKPLAPGLHVDNPPVTAETAASAITNSIIVGKAATGADAIAQGVPVAFAVNLTDPSRPGYVEFDSLDAAADHFAGLQSAGLLGDSWDDFAHFASDIWNGIKRAAITITDFVVKTAKKTIDFAVRVGDEIRHLTDVTIHGLEQAASIVQGVLHAIEAALADVLDWLKATFQWADIWDTKTALQGALGQVVPYLSGVLTEHAKLLTENFFSGLEDQVHAQITAMKGWYKTTDRLVDVVTRLGPMPPPVALGRTLPLRPAATAPLLDGPPLSSLTLFTTPAGLAVTPASFHSSGQHNWLLDKIQAYLIGVPDLPDLNVTDAFSDLHGQTVKIRQKVSDAYDSFRRAFLTLEDPKQFGTLGICNLLDAFEDTIDVVLESMDLLVQALLDVVKLVLEGLDRFLNAPLQIPLVTPLLQALSKEILGKDLPTVSIADVFCLLAAIPLTLVYKLSKGWDAKLFPGGKYPPIPASSAYPTSTPEAGLRLADDGQASEAIHFCLVGIVAVWALFDTVIDAATAGGGEIPFALSMIDIIFVFLAQIFAWPSEDGVPAPLPLETRKDKAAFANWIMGWLYPIVDGASLTMTQFPDGSAARRLLRSWEPIGKVVTSVLGGLNVITGILETTLGAESSGHAAANILGPFPRSMQFLMLAAEEEDTLGIAPLIKLVLDFFCGEGTAVALAAGD